MKKFIIASLIILAIMVAVVAVFIATFDIERYNKTIASQIGSAVGNPVEIGRLSLEWKGKILLGVEDFRILDGESAEKKPELSFERADMALELLPLLSKQFKVSSVSVSGPKLHLVRAKDGAIEIRGYRPKAVNEAAKKAAAPAAAALNFSVRSIVVRNGTLRFEDLAGEAPADITIDSIDADIKNVSLITPVDIAVKMALLSAKQNFSISGTAGPFISGVLNIKDLNADIDLATIDHSKLVRAVPAAQKIGIKEGLAGLIKAEIKKLELDGNKIKNLSADLALTGGRISLSQLKAPIEKMDLSASVQNDKLSIRSFSAAVSDAVLKGSGDITNIYAKPGSTLRIEAEVKSLKQFLALLAGSKQGLDGKAGLSFNGSMSGTTWDDISQTISGSGKFSLDNGVLTDTNLLAQSLEKLSMFPGLAEKVKEFLPAQLRESLGREYTLLKPISQQFTVKDGIAAFNDLKIDTDFGNLKGAANLALKGEVNGTGMLSFSPELSGALIKAAAPMSYLADGQNIVAFPITFKISGAGSSVMPDLKYIGTRVMAQKGGELLNDLLNKGSGKEQPSGAAGGQTETQGTGDIMDNLKKLLNKEE
ncbi:MAG: AsmA family protein [Candidatus Omnitrophica bacterium]|nr:AsmA family protein [Candidatus Omnitrophota bacterium]